MDGDESVLTLEIDGRWTATEFGLTCRVLSELYNFRLMRTAAARWLDSLARDERRRDHAYEGRIPEVVRFLLRSREHPAVLRTDEWTDAAYLHRLVSPSELLRVKRVTYESPGVIDFLGIGAIVGHVKDFIVELFPSNRRKRELENETRELENAERRVRIARDFVALRVEGAAADLQERQLAAWATERAEPIQKLIEQGKIKEIRHIDGTRER